MHLPPPWVQGRQWCRDHHRRRSEPEALTGSQYYSGFSKARREKVLNAEQYKMIMTEAATNRVNEDKRIGYPTDGVAKAIVENPALLGDGSVDTDWLDQVLRTGYAECQYLGERWWRQLPLLYVASLHQPKRYPVGQRFQQSGWQGKPGQ